MSWLRFLIDAMPYDISIGNCDIAATLVLSDLITADLNLTQKASIQSRVGRVDAVGDRLMVNRDEAFDAAEAVAFEVEGSLLTCPTNGSSMLAPRSVHTL